jgi:hypothetical protein
LQTVVKTQVSGRLESKSIRSKQTAQFCISAPELTDDPLERTEGSVAAATVAPLSPDSTDADSVEGTISNPSDDLLVEGAKNGDMSETPPSPLSATT